MYRVALLSLFLTSAACQSTCVASANTETNSQEECKYLKPCTVESGKVPVSAPEGYSVECEQMPCPADQDIMFDKIEGTDIGELLPASCDNTVAMCKDACEQTTGCCGFNFVWNPGAYSSTSMGRCVAKACDGRIGTSRYGMVFFARDGGAVLAGMAAVNDAMNDAVNDAIALGTGVLIAIIVAPIVVLLCVIGLIVYCCCCKKKQGVSSVA